VKKVNSLIKEKKSVEKIEPYIKTWLTNIKLKRKTNAQRYASEAQIIFNTFTEVDAKRLQNYVQKYCDKAVRNRTQLDQLWIKLNQRHLQIQDNNDPNQLALLDEILDKLDNVEKLLKELDMHNKQHESYNIDWLDQVINRSTVVIKTEGSLEETAESKLKSILGIKDDLGDEDEDIAEPISAPKRVTSNNQRGGYRGRGAPRNRRAQGRRF